MIYRQIDSNPVELCTFELRNFPFGHESKTLLAYDTERPADRQTGPYENGAQPKKNTLSLIFLRLKQNPLLYFSSLDATS